MWILILQRLALDFLLDLVYFPVWWYSAGAKKALLFCFHRLQDANAYLAPGLWFKNVFVPMFGQYDWQGRIVSFIVRLANVIMRSFGMLLWLTILVIVFFAWIVFPIFVVSMFVQSLFV